MDFLILLCILVFMFSFIGVIILLKRTSDQGELIDLLSKRLDTLSTLLQTGQSEKKPEPSPKPETVIKSEPSPAIKYEEKPISTSFTENIPSLSSDNKESARETFTETQKDNHVPLMQNSQDSEAAPHWFDQFKKFFSGGNLWAAGGVIFLIVAFGMLITFLARRGFFTVEMGIAAAALCGIFMVIFGWRFKSRRPVYFLLLQGGGIGILYLSVFAAHKFTPYFPAAVSIIFLTVLVIPAVVLALFQNSQVLALLGFLGGFASPILLSTGEGNHIFLFSYYLIINLSILFILFRRQWKWLGFSAFMCTFIVLLYWVINRYDKTLFLSTEPFFISFIAIFTIIGIRSFREHDADITGLCLIAGTPLLGMIVQWNLVYHFQHGHAASSIIFSALYLALIIFIWRKYGKTIRPVAEGYLALAVLLANIAIPLELSKEITSAVWAAEGVVLLLLGLRLTNFQIQIWGFILHIAGAIAFMAGNKRVDYGINPFMSPQYIGSLVIALSALIMVLMLNRFLFKNKTIPKILTVWALVWGFGSYLFEVDRITDISSKISFFAINEPWGLFLAGSSLGALFIYIVARFFRYSWLNIAVIPSLTTAALLVLKTFIMQSSKFIHQPTKILSFNFFHDEYILGWLLFFSIHILLIALLRKKTTEETIPSTLHAAWLFTVVLAALSVITASGRYLTVYLNLANSWTSLAGILPTLALLLGITFISGKVLNVSQSHKKLLFSTLPSILMIILGLWFLVTLFLQGEPDPLPLYIPFINPLDLQQGFCIAGITLRLMQNRKRNKNTWMENKYFAVMDVMLFLWITAIISRSVHFYAHIPMYSMLKSHLFHLGIFIFWALYGIAHIIAGHKKSLRPVWIAGAVLTIVDIIKLLLFDLADTGTISRIVSFFIAGIILLFIGWAAPLPPSRPRESHED